ncbi:GAF and ANTAR domain-containing protein [Winogradskya humida]|uniref:Transcriptional regulator n=1 Tax=Winogradskya humida TaxID=113566 RepID=A0ABQ4A5N7_9ACTN|nr:GAF and ANTAR domain-containing protein [Actinoplanes humidus]GIE26172.1 transcriptional regulator [Actinoplanes humidus]
MSTVSVARLAPIFVKVADTLVDDFDLIDFLTMVTTQAADLVGAAAVGLLLADRHGRLEFMAGSNENVKVVELFQLHARQGPCLDAFRAGRPVINVNLDGATPRWPRFAPRATSQGFRSVHAFPLRLRNQVIGVMNVFGDKEGGDFSAAEVPIMQAVADVAAIGLLQERAIRHGEALTGQLQGALASRVVIEQAKGAVAQAARIGVDEAFTIVRGYARQHNLKIVDVAQAVVTDATALSRVLCY